MWITSYTCEVVWPHTPWSCICVFIPQDCSSSSFSIERTYITCSQLSCIYQSSHIHETQLANWSHGQATVFSRHVWIKTDEDENKNKKEVLFLFLMNWHIRNIAFMYYIFKQLTESFPKIKIMNIFSDCAGSQFKQRFLFSNLYYWKKQHLSIVWIFFVTSHGKGVVDGLGGTVKRAVWWHIQIVQSCKQDLLQTWRYSTNNHPSESSWKPRTIYIWWPYLSFVTDCIWPVLLRLVDN